MPEKAEAEELRRQAREGLAQRIETLGMTDGYTAGAIFASGWNSSSVSSSG